VNSEFRCQSSQIDSRSLPRTLGVPSSHKPSHCMVWMKRRTSACGLMSIARGLHFCFSFTASLCFFLRIFAGVFSDPGRRTWICRLAYSPGAYGFFLFSLAAEESSFAPSPETVDSLTLSFCFPPFLCASFRVLPSTHSCSFFQFPPFPPMFEILLCQHFSFFHSAGAPASSLFLCAGATPTPSLSAPALPVPRPVPFGHLKSD